MKKKKSVVIESFALFVFVIFAIFSCKKDKISPKGNTNGNGNGISTYNPTPYQFNYSSLFVDRLPPMPIPADNQMTQEGIALGRTLFFDKRLSKNENMSCASCHQPSKAFSDSPNQFTTVAGALEFRNTPAIINAGWTARLFWDGRASHPALENQAHDPVVNPNEMNADSWTKVVQKLQQISAYPPLFKAAFGSETIDSTMVLQAIAQFERTLISDNSKMDRYLQGEVNLTSEETAGLNLFMSERGNCFHCHGGPGDPLWTDNGFHDTGLDLSPTDLGLGGVTGNSADNGKFKTPTLRNLVFTAPYMHDGRFATLGDVIDFYSTGIKTSPNLDPNYYRANQGGAHFTQQEKDELIAFLKTLTDSSYVNNPDFQAP